MLDSLDARERSYDNSANGINFTIRKVNLMFVFIVVVWIFFFNKYMIQNPVFFVYNVIYVKYCLRNCLVAGDPRSCFEKEPTVNSRTRHALCDSE